MREGEKIETAIGSAERAAEDLRRNPT